MTHGLGGALAAQTLDLAVTVNLVVLEDGEFGLFALVLDLLGSSVDLLFALLAATTEAEHEVEGGFLLDVVVRKGTAVLELLAGEDQALLVWGNSLLVYGGLSDGCRCGLVYGRSLTLDLGLDIVDGVGRLHLKGDSLTRDCVGVSTFARHFLGGYSTHGS